jgi:hypothetical protein
LIPYSTDPLPPEIPAVFLSPPTHQPNGVGLAGSDLLPLRLRTLRDWADRDPLPPPSSRTVSAFPKSRRPLFSFLKSNLFPSFILIPSSSLINPNPFSFWGLVFPLLSSPLRRPIAFLVLSFRYLLQTYQPSFLNPAIGAPDWSIALVSGHPNLPCIHQPGSNSDIERLPLKLLAFACHHPPALTVSTSTPQSHRFDEGLDRSPPTQWFAAQHHTLTCLGALPLLGRS